MRATKAESLHAIVYCVDGSYLNAAGISAMSIWDNLGSEKDLDLIVCIEPGVKVADQRAFNAKMRRECGVEAQFLRSTLLERNSGSLEKIDAGRFTTASLRRIQVPLVLRHYERILYLDADTLAVSALPPLNSVDLAQRPFAASRDAFVHTWEHDGGIPGAIGRATETYFNAGVLLIDPPVWEKEDLTRRAFAYLSENSNRLRYYDQDALNVAASGNWSELPEAWNHMHSWDIEDDIRGKATILHTSGELKFWHSDFPAGTRRSTYSSYQSRWHGGPVETATVLARP